MHTNTHTHTHPARALHRHTRTHFCTHPDLSLSLLAFSFLIVHSFTRPTISLSSLYNFCSFLMSFPCMALLAWLLVWLYWLDSTSVTDIFTYVTTDRSVLTRPWFDCTGVTTLIWFYWRDYWHVCWGDYIRDHNVTTLPCMYRRDCTDMTTYVTPLNSP